MSFTSPSLPVYRLARFSVWLFLRIYLRFKTHGLHHVPAIGGCIVAANHVSFIDPPAVACAVRHRMVSFMARDTLFRPKPVAWLFYKFGIIPISREKGDVGALKKGIQSLREGCCLGLFPEGTRSPTGEPQQAKGGIGFLVAKAMVPVVPVYVDGSFAAYPKGAKRIKPGKVQVIFGPPIMPDELKAMGNSRDAYDKIGALVMARIAALKPLAS